MLAPPAAGMGAADDQRDRRRAALTCLRRSSSSSACSGGLTRGMQRRACAPRGCSTGRRDAYDFRSAQRAAGAADGVAARRSRCCRGRAIACSRRGGRSDRRPARRFGAGASRRRTAAVGAQRADARWRRLDRRAQRRQRRSGSLYRRRSAAALHGGEPGGGRGAERAPARLHPRRQAGVGGDLRRDRRRDRGVRSRRTPVARQRRPGRAARASRSRRYVASLRRGRSLQRPVPALRRRRQLGGAACARTSPAASRSSASRPVPCSKRSRRRGDRADRQERDSRHPERATHAADERRTRRHQWPPGRDRRAPQGDAGAAAPGREALGDRPAGRRRRARAEQSARRASSATPSCCRRSCAVGTGATAAAERRAARARPPPHRRGVRARRDGSSATCWPSRGGSRPRARRRTSPT